MTGGRRVREDVKEDRVARVPAAVTRPVRTGAQGGAAYLIIEAIDAFDLYDFDGRQYAVAMLILTALVSLGQTLFENRIGHGLLRQVPPTDELVEVPGEGGYVQLDLVAICLLGLFVIGLLFAIGLLPANGR